MDKFIVRAVIAFALGYLISSIGILRGRFAFLDDRLAPIAEVISCLIVVSLILETIDFIFLN